MENQITTTKTKKQQTKFINKPHKPNSDHPIVYNTHNSVEDGFLPSFQRMHAIQNLI